MCFRNGHAHICQPLVKKTESHILHINFIGDSLQKFRSSFSTLESGHHLRMAFRREITPPGLFTRLCIMNHLKTFFRKESTETEHPYHSPFNDATGNLLSSQKDALLLLRILPSFYNRQDDWTNHGLSRKAL